MKIGILTSSRADYGIYTPLLQKMKIDSFFDLEIITFGSHLSKNHGYTVEFIEKDNYETIHKITSLLTNDDEQSIATSYGLTTIKFADFWANNAYDLVFCLGDRFEMSAAVQAGIPFGVKFAHIHGGETTLGAIDNVYRHQITLASQLHFTSSSRYKKKVENILEQKHNIFSVGSLSLDELTEFKPIERKTFFQKFDFEDKDFALVTFHPETVAFKDNLRYAYEMKKALQELVSSMNVVITMPNADTLGSVYRKELEEFQKTNSKKVLLIENFGKENYFSAMHYSRIIIGNSSSGIVEAASFGKYVVNVGNRQKGRAKSKNVLDAEFTHSDIISKINYALKLGDFNGENIYYKRNVADTIIKILKEHEKL